ncbi:MAG: MBL fold metallo-hydrolase [Lentisphaerae bacterium]|nr:MBL fold metallo-hydrolase [Lentisphaerota bacterium]MBT4818939.1 MBL fold metallo-hydrolase [Lentisphaerota bacterium]MBT5608227.1 MBL fold metallo-hydrolase [Lentisphaerota bacterium]MBT7058884.1 MBL fold metallo-hydrolase [Lentisphaerota bacterium]MBT7842885.1 MBL fold metallo-hydrolase [Lentisphaerota bacterium]
MRWLCIIACLTGVGVAHSKADTLGSLRPRLLKQPASAQQNDQRQALLKSLDSFLEQPNSECSDEVAAYYQSMIDHALDEIATLNVVEGIIIWKLYSSAMVVKTPQAVFGIDLDEGPNSNSGNPDRSAGLADIRLHMTPQQRTRLAELVDASFHTHRHHDHVNYQITEALVKAGKTVVVPEDIRAMWRDEPFASGLTVLTPLQGRQHRVGHLGVEVLGSRQWMAQDHSVECPCNAYLITTDNGVSILSKGDINDGQQMLPWLTQVKDRGDTIDLYVSSLFFWSGKDAFAPIQRMFDPFIIPGHEYEFTHRKRGKPGSGTGSYSSQSRALKTSIARGKCAVLSWGERFHYIPQQHRQATAPLVWIAITPEPKESTVTLGDTLIVRLNAGAGGVSIRRRYLAFKSTPKIRAVPGFDLRPWGAIMHDEDGEGVFKVSTTGWTPGHYVLECTADDWPEGSTRTTDTISVTVVEQQQ